MLHQAKTNGSKYAKDVLVKYIVANYVDKAICIMHDYSTTFNKNIYKVYKNCRILYKHKSRISRLQYNI